MKMLSSGGLLGAVDAFEKQEDVTFGYRLWPPVRLSNIYLVASHISIQKCVSVIKNGQPCSAANAANSLASGAFKAGKYKSEGLKLSSVC